MSQGAFDQQGGIPDCQHAESGPTGFCLECGAGPITIARERNKLLSQENERLKASVENRDTALKMTYEAIQERDKRIAKLEKVVRFYGELGRDPARLGDLIIRGVYGEKARAVLERK